MERFLYHLATYDVSHFLSVVMATATNGVNNLSWKQIAVLVAIIAPLVAAVWSVGRLSGQFDSFVDNSSKEFARVYELVEKNAEQLSEGKRYTLARGERLERKVSQMDDRIREIELRLAGHGSFNKPAEKTR